MLFTDDIAQRRDESICAHPQGYARYARETSSARGEGKTIDGHFFFQVNSTTASPPRRTPTTRSINPRLEDSIRRNLGDGFSSLSIGFSLDDPSSPSVPFLLSTRRTTILLPNNQRWQGKLRDWTCICMGVDETVHVLAGTIPYTLALHILPSGDVSAFCARRLDRRVRTGRSTRGGRDGGGFPPIP